MAKFVLDAVLDAALAEIATGVALHVNTTQPADRAAAISDSLGTVALTAGDGNGDWTIANGDTSGRKITLGAQNIAAASGSGTATHISIIDGTRLLLVTTCTSQAITSGNPIAVAAFDDEIADAA